VGDLVDTGPGQVGTVVAILDLDDGLAVARRVTGETVGNGALATVRWYDGERVGDGHLQGQFAAFKDVVGDMIDRASSRRRPRDGI
jgi:hypothetical protein